MGLGFYIALSCKLQLISLIYQVTGLQIWSSKTPPLWIHANYWLVITDYLLFCHVPVKFSQIIYSITFSIMKVNWSVITCTLLTFSKMRETFALFLSSGIIPDYPNDSNTTQSLSRMFATVIRNVLIRSFWFPQKTLGQHTYNVSHTTFKNCSWLRLQKRKP